MRIVQDNASRTNVSKGLSLMSVKSVSRVIILKEKNAFIKMFKGIVMAVMCSIFLS
jgi:hypothetical protein